MTAKPMKTLEFLYPVMQLLAKAISIGVRAAFSKSDLGQREKFGHIYFNVY